MTAENLFSGLNLAILPAWLALLIAPIGWRGMRVLLHSALAPGLLGLFYAGALGMMYASGPVEGGFEGVQRALSTPWGLLAIWSHVVAFDFFIGAWQVRDAARHGISRWWLVPCLVATLFYGPLGLLLYLVVRGVLRREAREPLVS